MFFLYWSRCIEFQKGYRLSSYEAVERARDYLLGRIGDIPDLALVMGSGISIAREVLRDAVSIPYAEIPSFPVPMVAGHNGQAHSGKAGRTRVLLFEGRVHLYEGWTMQDVCFCARVIGRIGTGAILLTNAAGALNP